MKIEVEVEPDKCALGGPIALASGSFSPSPLAQLSVITMTYD